MTTLVQVPKIDESKIGVSIKSFAEDFCVQMFYPMDENGFWIHGDNQDGMSIEILSKIDGGIPLTQLTSMLSVMKEQLIWEIKDKEFARLNPDVEWKTFGKDNGK